MTINDIKFRLRPYDMRCTWPDCYEKDARKCGCYPPSSLVESVRIESVRCRRVTRWCAAIAVFCVAVTAVLLLVLPPAGAAEDPDNAESIVIDLYEHECGIPIDTDTDVSQRDTSLQDSIDFWAPARSAWPIGVL